MQIQLDLLGGLAGDMFIAAVLDAFPEHAGAVVDAVSALQQPFGRIDSRVALDAHNDGVLKGSRFRVDEGRLIASAARQTVPVHGHLQAEPGHDDHSHDGSHDHDDEHRAGHAHGLGHHATTSPTALELPADPVHHVPWSAIRTTLQSALAPGVLRHALGIFGALAEAEAEVHGVAVEAVEFHEVGAWDSVVDIVGAAVLIEALDVRHWQVGPVPLGSGRIRTAHGLMPVPPPATALLLRGFQTLDDGIAGERVTPTGAAILKYLVSDADAAPAPRSAPRVLRRSGVGFGTRRLEGISNCVRLLAFDDPAPVAAAARSHRELAVVEFEVDDQSAEELAMGLDRLRSHPAVFDVVQSAVFGKKGRMMTSIRLLAGPADIDAVLDACFRETTTIGLRYTTVWGRALPRRADEVVVDGQRVRVKTVERPGGTTAKAESDDALGHATHQARRRIRAEAERLVLQSAVEASRDV